MQPITDGVMYVLSFKPFVLLPIIIFILSLIFRLKVSAAIRSALMISIGFSGIFIVFDYFVKIMHPVIESLILRTGLHMNVLDTGWPPLSAITWSSSLAPVLVLVFIAVNILMLALRLTKTVNIDIWNYWHVIFASVMVYFATKSLLISVISGVIAFIIVLKLAEWSAPMVNRFSGMNGICIPHLSGLTYFPFALVINSLMDRIPGFKNIDANPETIEKKLGLAGEPLSLGFIMGVLLGIGAGYDIKQIGELAFGFAAVVFILPRMCGILGSALIPVSDGMKLFISKNFPVMGKTYIGLDVAVLFGVPSVVSTTLLLTPATLILAFTLPGISFIPLGDLTNLLVPVALISVAVRGNIIRAFIIGVPAVIANLYIASYLAPFLTGMAKSVNFQITDYNGTFTSFLDGGNIFRYWILKASSGDPVCLALIPLVILLLYATWKITKKINAAI
ncbi:MAG: PTS transporter subunit IIC [Brevinematales bacterium]|jgi:PTS system galactitol-specific IIC component